jgi:hypothetical protein
MDHLHAGWWGVNAANVILPFDTTTAGVANASSVVYYQLNQLQNNRLRHWTLPLRSLLIRSSLTRVRVRVRVQSAAGAP